jgi:hypothetical protein
MDHFTLATTVLSFIRLDQFGLGYMIHHVG